MGLFSRSRTSPAALAEQYASAVVTVLAPVFPDLKDAVTASIVRHHVAANFLEPSKHLEVIVDDPFSASWRLRTALGSNRVRLSYYGRSPVQEAEEERLNALLAAIEV